MKLNPIEITRETSRRLAVMGFLCACMIVLIHCTTRPSLDPNQWQWWVVNLVGADGFCRIAVPYFFVASGFFLVGRINEGGWYFTAVKKRIRTLLIPFVVWAFVGIAFDWCMYHGIRLTGYNHHIANPLANGAISAFICALGFDPTEMNIGPIWYLRMLFLLVLISPLICYGINKAGLFLPLVFFVVYGIYDLTIHYSHFWEYVFSIRGLAYFIIGCAIRLCGVGFLIDFQYRKILFLIGWGALIGAVLARRYETVLLGNFFDFLMVPPLMLGVWGLTRYINLPKFLVGNSFPVYLLHIFWLKISVLALALFSLQGLRSSSVLVMVLG